MSSELVKSVGQVLIKSKKGEKTININDPAVEGLYSSVKIFMSDLIKNEGKLNKNFNNLNILIKETIEFASKYKEVKGAQKKELVLSLLNDIFDTEIENADISDDMKSILELCVDNTIDPAIELALYAASGNISINPSFLKKFCPCIKFK